MHKDNRLKTKSDFKKLYTNSKKLTNNELVLILKQNSITISRFGFSIKKKFGTAVKRNKIKRRLKESIRNLNIQDGWDLILIPRKNIKTKNYHQIKFSVRNLLNQAGLLKKFK
ncbi:MAG: ribonuclease P protein component [Chloroflexi bacterium]|nr:ribonuclease P protein component [Chloroflexota bacterium]|tara:strand:- start:607 stop:945 length:339 start_codon:yes stop_codon:yes gene_type:complete